MSEAEVNFIRARTWVPAELEVRGDGRTLFGLAVPYNQEAEVSDGGPRYREVFRPGAFARTINAQRSVKLLANHDRKAWPVGKASALRETPAGLVGEFRVSATTNGDEALTLVRDGVLDSFSVGFSPVKHQTTSDGVVERTEVNLHEVSLVAFPAYAGAVIEGVRMDYDLAILTGHAHARAKYTADELRTMAKNGQAMEDQSYPIADAEDLSNAIHAVGRGGADHDMIRRHIIKRAAALGLSDQIPENWNADGSMRSEPELSTPPDEPASDTSSDGLADMDDSQPHSSGPSLAERKQRLLLLKGL